MALFPAVAAISDRPLFAVALDGTIVLWDAALARLLGITADRALGRPCHQVVGGCSLPGSEICRQNCPTLRAAAQDRTYRSFEMCLRAADGRPVQTRVHTVLLHRPPAILHLLDPLSNIPTESALDSPGPGLPTEGLLFPELTTREQEVLRLLCLGATTGEVASRLSISRATARNHIQRVIAKRGAHSRLEAVTRALSQPDLESQG
jgi:DNA-binding CsgD family transcriptional regulator